MRDLNHEPLTWEAVATPSTNLVPPLALTLKTSSVLLEWGEASSVSKGTSSTNCEKLGGADLGSELRAITLQLSDQGQVTFPSLSLNFTICGKGTIMTTLKKYGEDYIEQLR